MGLRFRKSVKLFPGVRLNFNKNSTSFTLGGRGASMTFGKRGTTATIGIPGTGLSYTSFSSNRRNYGKRRHYKRGSQTTPYVGHHIDISQIPTMGYASYKSDDNTSGTQLGCAALVLGLFLFFGFILGGNPDWAFGALGVCLFLWALGCGHVSSFIRRLGRCITYEWTQAKARRARRTRMQRAEEKPKADAVLKEYIASVPSDILNAAKPTANSPARNMVLLCQEIGMEEALKRVLPDTRKYFDKFDPLFLDAAALFIATDANRADALVHRFGVSLVRAEHICRLLINSNLLSKEADGSLSSNVPTVSELPMILESVTINNNLQAEDQPKQPKVASLYPVPQIDRDPLFAEVAEIVVSSGIASISSIERRYSIDFYRACKIMSQLEIAGIVSQPNHNGERRVLADIATVGDVIRDLDNQFDCSRDEGIRQLGNEYTFVADSQIKTCKSPLTIAEAQAVVAVDLPSRKRLFNDAKRLIGTTNNFDVFQRRANDLFGFIYWSFEMIEAGVPISSNMTKKEALEECNVYYNENAVRIAHNIAAQAYTPRKATNALPVLDHIQSHLRDCSNISESQIALTEMKSNLEQVRTKYNA